VRDQWLIDSAGTGGHVAGNPIYGSAQKVLNKNGINYQHTARKVNI
jgi:protein-tyrosine-phosphatase